jgi:hypothetical protein
MTKSQEIAGWKLVPWKPTPEMVEAYRKAIKRHIESLPAAKRAMMENQPGGIRLDERQKLKIRWEAMLAAAPKKDEAR